MIPYGDYGVKFNVTLDCCYSKRQAKKRKKMYRSRARYYDRKAREVSGLSQGGFEFIKRGRESAQYMSKAAWYMKEAKKFRRMARKIDKCKRFPCFPSFKGSWNGYGDYAYGALTAKEKVDRLYGTVGGLLLGFIGFTYLAAKTK